MLPKLLIISLILPVGAASTDDEIIKNLEFFQSMDMLKDEIALVAPVPAHEKKEIKKEEMKKSAPEKK